MSSTTLLQLTVDQLRVTAEAGGIVTAIIKAEGPGFYLNLETRKGDAILVTFKRQPRVFADPRKILMLLRDVGIRQARIDTANWRPEEQDLLKRSRPDRKEVMTKANRIAAGL